MIPLNLKTHEVLHHSCVAALIWYTCGIWCNIVHVIWNKSKSNHNQCSSWLRNSTIFVYFRQLYKVVFVPSKCIFVICTSGKYTFALYTLSNWSSDQNKKKSALQLVISSTCMSKVYDFNIVRLRRALMVKWLMIFLCFIRLRHALMVKWPMRSLCPIRLRRALMVKWPMRSLCPIRLRRALMVKWPMRSLCPG